MPGDFDDLGWVRPDGFRYSWVESRSTSMRTADSMLTLAQPASVKFRSYQPLDVDGLFLAFAELPQTPEAVLDFASRYGPLGIVTQAPLTSFGTLTPLTYPERGG